MDRPKPLARKVTPEERSYYAGLIEGLKRRRMQLGISQAELDHRLGTSEGLVAKWEAYMRLPGSFFLMCWAQALNVKLEVTEQH